VTVTNTYERVRRCARRRLAANRFEGACGEEGIEDVLQLHVGAVGVYHVCRKRRGGAMEGRIFPVGRGFHGIFGADFQRLRRASRKEIRRSVEAGAREIDVVITRRWFGAKVEQLYGRRNEIVAFRI